MKEESSFNKLIKYLLFGYSFYRAIDLFILPQMNDVSILTSPPKQVISSQNVVAPQFKTDQSTAKWVSPTYEWDGITWQLPAEPAKTRGITKWPGPKHEPDGAVDFGALGKHFDVYAMADGVVAHAGWFDENYQISCYEGCEAAAFGIMVSILHADGLYSVYGHLESTTVEIGQQISRGTKIGEVGNFTGFGTGPHLHVHLNDQSDNRETLDYNWHSPVSICNVIDCYAY